MRKWDEFEIKCTDFLNKKFGTYANFIHKGGADSTVPDILVKTNSGNLFYIDAKYSPAQCGQFVLFPNFHKRVFEYSSLNANSINIYAEKIMDYMNDDFDTFSEAGTSGKAINMPNGSNIFSDWIIQSYKGKGVHFFITNNYTILPIEHFKMYFDVTAKYRIKRSGSRDVGKNCLNLVINYILSHGYSIKNYSVVESKLFVVSEQQLNNKRFIIDDTEYMFSLREDEYEIRKLSNTYNANVIFSIEYREDAKGMSEKDFIECLK